ncbi:MAG: isopenicillin N synthase family oxygenase [Thaumarchaeota archaeon]|nr:isopenicillin N synthase family oxygenase [Nitrososphaerota archaeon]
MSAIPIIDLDMTDTDGVTLSEKIDIACREIGVFQVIGHGIPRTVYDRVYDAAEGLWALPIAEKEKLRDPHEHPFRGWRRFLDPKGETLQERWYVNRFDGPLHAHALGVPTQFSSYFSPNIWPHNAPDLVEATVECFDAYRHLAERMMIMFCSALNLPIGTFEPLCGNDASYLAMQAYPGLSKLPPGSPAMREHTDSGTLTILHQRGQYAGLQVRLRNGEWETIQVSDEALIIFVGDMMTRLTNDRWRAVPHRAIQGEIGQRRASLTLFYTPPVDAIIRPLASFIEEGGPLYEPTTVFAFDREYQHTYST